jgi:hypothetical protein
VDFQEYSGLLEYWQDQADSKSAEISSLKTELHQQEKYWKEREQFLMESIDESKRSSPVKGDFPDIEGTSVRNQTSTSDNSTKSIDERKKIGTSENGSIRDSANPGLSKLGDAKVIQANSHAQEKPKALAEESDGIVEVKTENGAIAIKAGLPDKLLDRLLSPAYHGNLLLQRLSLYANFYDDFQVIY